MSDPSPKERSRQLLVGQLVGLAAQLQAVVDYVDSDVFPDSEGPGDWLRGLGDFLARPPAQEVLRRWRSVFREELDLVRRARNSVVHGRDIGDENLENAVAVARRLLGLVMEPFTKAGPGSIFWNEQ